MTSNPPCPHCSSGNTTFKAKAQLWECDDCEERFADPGLVSRAKSEPQTIFLSYAHKSEREEDYDVSEELVWLIKDELEKDGHHVWIDHEGIAAGAQWRERITTAILSHTHFLSFLSKRSVRDPGVCLNEIAIALGSGRQIQTLLTESEESVRQPLTISHLQWHQFSDWKAIKEGQKMGPKGEGWDAWFGEHMTLIRNNLSDVQRIKVAGDLQRLKDILDPRTFEADIIAKIEGFYGRRWLFEACDHWLNTSTNRLFWLKGSPGIGKSCFAAKLVHQSNSAIVGFFKCEFQGSKSPEESASECIRTLAYQLAARLPDYRMKLLYQQQLDKDKVQKKTADDLFSYLITEPLNVSGKIPEATRLALVIDALDEAGRNDGTNALADLIYKHADKLPPWLGIIVTSRPEPYLEQQLGRFDATSIEGGTEQNLQDLRDYLNEKLDPSIQEPQRSIIIDQIIDKSGGTFLYLKLIEKDKTLDLSKPESLPTGIDDVFTRDFKRYYPNAKDYGQDAEPFLRLMAAAPGPLPIDLGKDLLGWGRRDITTKVIQPLGSLLQEKEGGMVFFHKSLSDWLQDSKRSGNYQVNDTGAKELGNFLWKEYQQYENSQWQAQVVEWLATLLPSTDHWNDLEDLDQFADFLEGHLRYQTSLDLRARSVSIVEDLDLSKSPEYIELIDKAGDLYSLLAQYPKAEILFNHSLTLRVRIDGNDPESTINSYSRLGLLCKHTGAYKKSEDYYSMALQIAEELKPVNLIRIARISNDLAGMLNMRAEYSLAEELIRYALDIQDKLLKDDDIEIVNTLNALAILLRDGGKYNEAQVLYERAQSVLEKKIYKEHPDIARGLNNMGCLKSDMGKHDEALPILQRALEMREKLFGLDHPLVAQSLHNLANLCAILGDDSHADLLYRRSLAIRVKTIGPMHHRTASTLYRYANLLENLGRYDEAYDMYSRSNQIRISLFGLKHPIYTYDLD